MHIRSIVWVAAVIGLFAGNHASAAPATQPVVEIIAVQVNRPMPAALLRISPGIPRRQFYPGNAEKGSVDLFIAVTIPDKQIVASRDEVLEIQTLVDDKYADLGRIKRDQGGYNNMMVSDDGHTTVLGIVSEKGPSPDASRVFVRGSATLRCAAEVKTSERIRLKLRVGQKLDAGPVSMTIRSISAGGPGRVQVGLEGGRLLEQVRSLQVFDSDGKVIPTPPEMANFAARNAFSTATSLYVPESVDEVFVAVTYCERMEMVTIPFELLVDLGGVKIGQPTTRPAPAVEQGARSVVPPRNPRQPVSASTAGTKTDWPPPPDLQTVSFPATRPAFVFPTTRPIPQAWESAGTPAPVGAGPTTLPSAAASIVSLTVNQVPESKPAPEWPGRIDFMFRQNGGTVVRLLLSLPDRLLLSVDPARTRIERYADDTGRELQPAFHRAMDGYAAGASPVRGFSSSIDGKSMLLNLHLNDSPTPGATRIFMKGSVVARVAGREATGEQKDVNLAMGSSIKAGEVTLRVSNMYLASYASGMPDAGPATDLRERRVAVQFLSNLSPDLIKSIQFFEPGGQEIPAVVNRQASYTDGAAEYPLDCNLARDAQRVNVRVTYYRDVQTVTIPFTVITGVGI